MPSASFGSVALENAAQDARDRLASMGALLLGAGAGAVLLLVVL